MNELSFNQQSEALVTKQPLWLQPSFINALTKLLSVPVYTKKTTIEFTDAEWQHMIDLGYIKIEDNQAKIVNEQKIIEIAKGGYDIR